MAGSKILTERQLLFLKLFGNHALSHKFYLSGGTTLAEFYIPYRLSEDLDFFSEEEVQAGQVVTFLKSIKNELGYKNFEFNTSFNRNLFFLKFEDEKLKLEFTYYPFTQLDSTKSEFGVKIDSIKDIAVNKIFTIYQNPRSRDFMDLYMIIKKYGFKIDDLVRNAKIKFDSHIDPLKLGAQFLLVDDVKDFPKLINPLDEGKWKKFFKDQAKSLKGSIIAR